jgi:hypothetical protein
MAPPVRLAAPSVEWTGPISPEPYLRQIAEERAAGQKAMQKELQADDARTVTLGVPYTNFNWKTVHAQNRGCNADHADHLAADVSNVVVANSELHGLFITGYGPMRVEDCLICHGNSFADGIHSLHLYAASFTELGGNANHATRWSMANLCCTTMKPATIC